MWCLWVLICPDWEVVVYFVQIFLVYVSFSHDWFVDVGIWISGVFQPVAKDLV